jgi:hypothetical protein
VSRRWTSVEVPWSVDYLEDPKFRVVIPKSGPVVIVLSQLDDRYFRGLEGQYEFHLQFRLHKEGEYEYIVRSNKAYYMKRSVSTELDLDAGVYWVLLKITAKRYPESPTVEEVIAKTCQVRREKLLSVGLSYDMAHAKGDFGRLYDEKTKREKQMRRDRRKVMAKKMYEARSKEHKKRKLRQMKQNKKKQEKDMRHMAAETASRLESFELQQDSNGVDDINGRSHSIAPSQPPRRRPTLTVDHQWQPSFAPVISRSATPDIRVQIASVGVDGLTLNDISSDDIGWDSELDVPDSEDEEPEAFKPKKSDKDEEDEEDEFERDPWNAVCVVGLRVFCKDQDAEIQVVRGEEFEATKSKILEDGRKRLDVDDSAKDSVEIMSPLSPTPRGSLVGLMGLLNS